jgi:multidrug resistance efflux pump
MHTAPAERLAVQNAAELEAPLAAVEHRLDALRAALVSQNLPAIDAEAAALHRALAAAVHHFSRAARQGGVPAPLRQRLAVASGQVAAQREALARATAALDRAIDVLLPAPPVAALYNASGSTSRNGLGGGGLSA